MASRTDRSFKLDEVRKRDNRRALFDRHPAACLIYHQYSLRILGANDAALAIYGYSATEMLELTLSDLFAHPQRDAETYLQQRDHDGHPLHRTLWEHRSREKTPLYLELLDGPAEFRGEPARLVVINDKSDKLQSDREARESERALLQLLNDSPDPTLVVNFQQRVRYANPAAELALGLDQTQLGEQSLPLPSDDRSRFEWSWEHGGQRSVFEVVRSISRWNSEDMTLLSMRDITERNQTNERLRLFERSLASTRNGIVIVDAQQPDQPITYVNPAFERITGYSQEEVRGRNCRFLQGSDTDQPAVRQLAEAIEQQSEINIVVKNYRKDGTAFWNDLFIAPVPDATGTVTHFVGVQNDISKQRRYENTLAYNASHDVLTDLPNRSLLGDRLQQGCQIARRYERSLAVLYIDLDEFKLINDLLGHQRGDQILIEVSERIKQIIRPGDTLARLAADEFVVLLPDLARLDDVMPIAEHILAEIAQPFLIDHSRYHLTASIGIVSSDGREEDPMTLVRQADLAMFEAKQSGHNSYHWYTDKLNQDVAYKMHLRGELQQALESDSFELHFQPQLSLTTGQISGLEALIRWRHPGLGLISPVDFIPLAESTGQISAISYWVLDAACRARLRLKQAGYSMPIAINLSPTLFKDSHLTERMVAVIEQYDLTCGEFELEILESVMVGQHDQAMVTLNSLRAAGFRLSIDDFGTGFSSLNYLKSLPIQTIKIDRSFIQEIIHDQRDAAIVRAIISMAHHLGLTVTAEGVETEAQAAFLKRDHCNNIQGFLHSPALPLDKLLSYLERKQRLEREQLPGAMPGGRCLLVLDDDPYILKSLSRLLRDEPYRVLLASSAEDAFKILAQVDVQVILSDQRMPEMSGTEFFSRVKSLYPNTVRLVLSGYTDLHTVTEAINQGAIYKFLTKPWDDQELRDTLSDAFEHVLKEIRQQS